MSMNLVHRRLCSSQGWADGTLLVLGLGPIGDMACRIALHNDPGRKVIGVDLVPEPVLVGAEL